MLKVYGIHGRTTALLQIPTNGGKAWMEIEFRRGRLGLGASNKAATYSTSDPTVQAIIENSPLFGNPIKLLSVYDRGDKVAAALATEKPSGAEVEPTIVEEVSTKEQAVAYLKAKGAKATQIRDDESILKYAAKIGVSFPNYNV